ncbi:MAG: ion channel [Chitinophagaceae bacterium]|nr:ion channel [Chitinophagaceae bacterium]
MTHNHAQKQEVGFGITQITDQRLMNSDGSSNFSKVGLPWYKTSSFYHFCISLSWLQFLLSVVILFLGINLIFTVVYFIIGAGHLVGLHYSNVIGVLFEIYFFSVQTLTTVGYGRVNPVGVLTNFIASFQTLVGLLFFSVITGLMYARFSKPRAFFLYSKNVLFSPYKDGYALMFRLANKLKYSIINVKVEITLSIIEKGENEQLRRNFYTPISLERQQIQFFPASWTIVHPIDASSPLYGLSWEEIQYSQLEIFVLISGFDETFDQQVHSKRSYHVSETVWGAKFEKMILIDHLGRNAADLSKIDLFEKAPIYTP